MGGRADGSQMSCSRNTAVLLSPQQTPLGSRIQGITPYELRMKKTYKTSFVIISKCLNIFYYT